MTCHYTALQIIECRRVLKWTYAYGYYLEDKVKSEFFEYLQGYFCALQKFFLTPKVCPVHPTF
jgi:hypothetical protein